jgi:hypothetical protein
LAYGLWALLLLAAAGLALHWRAAAQRRWEQRLRLAIESATLAHSLREPPQEHP